MEPNFVQSVLISVSVALLFYVHRADTIDCGTVNFVRPTILDGIATIKGEWPFVVAIEKRFKYICGGTIISNRHILTAAHCIQKKNSETAISPHEVTVRLGAYNLTDNNERGAIRRNVSEIILHEDWVKQVFERRFDADIAILVLSANITFSDAIQPVCMPANSVTDNMDGTVVGYIVRRRTVLAEIPRRIKVRAVNSSHCFREDDVVRSYSSERTFCGGNDGNGSPDVGDSGSGYFFTPGYSWAQYGIVAIIHTTSTGHVVPRAYHVYTNVTMFKDWIIENVNRTGGEVGEAKITVTMNCDYQLSVSTDKTESMYNCTLYNIDIPGANFETGSFNGSHLHGKTRQDVEMIHFVNGTMSHLPSRFGLFFENIKYLMVGEATSDSVPVLGTKVIRRSDLRNLKNLWILNFLRNEIESLQADALWDLPYLKSFLIIENKLKILSNETFSKNRDLVDVVLSSNQLDSLPANLFRYNRILETVDLRNNFFKTINEKIFNTNRRLRSAFFGSNQLEALPKHLFRNNFVLAMVDFKDNSLSAIDDDFFETNRKLIAIYFEDNVIASLPPQLFRNNRRLLTVDFRNNSITTIDANLFANNDNLYAVTFARNRLERLERNVFKSASLLNLLDLSYNRLRYIDIDITEFDQIGFIDLRGNDCINASYGYIAGKVIVENLVKIQNVVSANCGTDYKSNG